MKPLKLAAAWGMRDKLRAEAAKLWAEGAKLWAEGDKLSAEGAKLRAEGDKLSAESHRYWAEAIIEAFGNIKLEWKYRSGNYDCELENGEVYKWDEIEGETK